MPALDQPPPHGIMRGWLGPAAVEDLLAYALANRERFAPSALGQGAATGLDPAIRQSEKLSDLGPFAATITGRVREALPGMIAALGMTAFTHPRFETELVAHNDGAFYRRHKDTSRAAPSAESRRVISAVYYFHRRPKAFTGGALRLYALAGGSFADVEPENDALVFFPSFYPHEVMPVSCPSRRFEDSRFAVNCWVHQAL